MNIREQFETIHFLSGLVKEYPEYAGILAENKHRLRYEMAQEDVRNFAAGRCVKDFGDGSAILLVPILEAYFNLTAEDVARIFEERYELRPSYGYDCTGQPITCWYKLVKRRGMWYAYHCIGADC